MTSWKGQLLVATPELIAPIFTKSVILMLEHSGSGAAGVVLNRPTESTVAAIAEQVFEEFSGWPKPIMLGGPVPGPLLVLHANEGLSDQEVLPGVYSTVDAEKVREIVRLQVEPSLPLANYAGWSAGQLEGEIEGGSWVLVTARPALVFYEGIEDHWKAVMKEYHGHQLTELLGIRDQPEDPRLN